MIKRYGANYLNRLEQELEKYPEGITLKELNKAVVVKYATKPDKVVHLKQSISSCLRRLVKQQIVIKVSAKRGRSIYKLNTR